MDEPGPEKLKSSLVQVSSSQSHTEEPRCDPQGDTATDPQLLRLSRRIWSPLRCWPRLSRRGLLRAKRIGRVAYSLCARTPSHRDRVIYRAYAHNKGKSGSFSLVSMSATDAVICERQISQLRPFAKSHGGCSATSLSETISLGFPRYAAVSRSWLRHFSGGT